MQTISLKSVFTLSIVVIFSLAFNAEGAVIIGEDDVLQEIGMRYYQGEWQNSHGTVLRNVNQTMAYAHAGYGLSREWEVFGRIGAADFVFENSFSDGITNFEDSYQPYGTIGLRGTLLQGKHLALNAFADSSYFADYSDGKTVFIPGSAFGGLDLVEAKEEISVSKQWEANAGIALVFKMRGFSIYGGPLAYWRQADIDARQITVDGDRFTLNSGTMKEKGHVGISGGIEIPLSNLGSLRLEAQQKSALTFAVAISFLKFNF